MNGLAHPRSACGASPSRGRSHWPGKAGSRAALVLAVGFLVFVGGVHAQLTDTEQRIVTAVKQRSPAALELLERSVRINSGTLNAQGVREVGAIYRKEFDELGFKTQWDEMPASMKRGGHLLAVHEGSAGKRLLLLGHLDTVFEPSSSVPLWEQRGDKVRGQGVNDMKGGDVIMIEALRALKSVGALDTARIEVVLTGDEERTGSPRETARASMIAAAKRSDYALSFEGSGRHEGQTTAVITRRSSGGWTLVVRGKAGHSMGVFSERSGFGAIYEGARILDAFRQQLIEPNLTFNVGAVFGGTDTKYASDTATGTAFGKSNVIAREFRAEGDMRFLTPEQGDRVKQRMRQIVAASLPGTSATIEFRDGYPPMPPTDAGTKLLLAYSKASEDAGLGPVKADDPAMRGAGDVQHVAPYTTGMDGLGAYGTGAHTDDEDLEIASIERGAIRAALMIYRLTRP
ncbi:M20/M25/M40 family metallo-hydrolase [Caenimonas koreensis DSM 17982]|uniref:M20/M25/M40 family metallo-hydrolase n=1 Tax=Caenimonas koreensis DSM 17982 TaxID=1121255 RepID=A0A844B0Z5_9BURK|nr:M20/M25/M40 family metallo-hydrolase [Caenimonas koreensis DSM 17982]